MGSKQGTLEPGSQRLWGHPMCVYPFKHCPHTAAPLYILHFKPFKSFIRNAPSSLLAIFPYTRGVLPKGQTHCYAVC